MNSTIGRPLAIAGPYLKPTATTLTRSVPGQDRLVLEAGQRLAARLEPRRAAELRDHARRACRSRPCARAGRGGRVLGRARARPPAARARQRSPRRARSRPTPATRDSARRLDQQPADAHPGQHDHHRRPARTCSAPAPASRAARTRSRRSPRRSTPAASASVDPVAAQHRQRHREQRGQLEHGRVQVQEAADRAEHAVAAQARGPEPSALVPATNGLREVSAGIPNHSSDQQHDPGHDQPPHRRHRAPGPDRVQRRGTATPRAARARPARRSTNAQRGRPERWQSIAARHSVTIIGSDCALSM